MGQALISVDDGGWTDYSQELWWSSKPTAGLRIIRRPPMNSGSQSLSALTGLRWLAALAVFVHHLTRDFELPRPKIWLGCLAVSFFFVLSGFILTYVYHDRLKTWRDGVGKFWFARWARIWPLHVVCLGILLVLAFCCDYIHVIGTSEQAPRILATNLLLLQSWVPHGPWAFSFNAVSWSISTEAFFYFVFPLLLIGGERQFWWKCAGFISVVIGLVFMLGYLARLPEYGEKHDFKMIFLTNPLLRLPEFCIGMATGFLFIRRSQRVRAFGFWRDTAIEIFVIVCFFGYVWTITSHVCSRLAGIEDANQGFSIWVTTNLFGWLFALMIYVFSSTSGAIGRALGCRLMVFLGEISFAFYLIHQIVLRYFTHYLLPDTTLSPLGLSICACSVSIALSILLYRLVEMPAKRALLVIWQRKWTKATAMTAASIRDFVFTSNAAVAALLIVVPTVVVAQNQWTSSLTPEQTQIVESTSVHERNIQFGDEIRLLGYRAALSEQGLTIENVWVKTKGEFTFTRYLHVCNTEGKIVGHGNPNLNAFSGAKLYEPFTDVIFVDNTRLVDADMVGVGFYRDSTMLRVNKGERSFGDYRLNLIVPKRWAMLQQALGHHDPTTLPPK